MNTMNKTEDDSPEESSWTFYIDEDFLCENNNDEQYSSLSSDYETLSDLVSDDAASSTAKRVNKNDQESAGFCCDHHNTSKYKISTFKRRKIKALLEMDDDLEDTASSPVNSPTVSYMNPFAMKQKEKATIDNISSKGKRNVSNHEGLAILEGNSEITELKRRGLCIVPLSTIANLL